MCFMTRILCAGMAAAMALTDLAACSSVGSGQPDAAAPGDGGASDAGVGAPADASAGDTGVAACSSPQDCPMHLGPQLYCCTDHNCTIDEPDACADGSERPILASNYDQSCTTDTDCMAIGEGNACSLVGPCPSAAINKGAYSQYQSDIAQTPCYGLSGCPSGSGPCCRHGTCGLNAACYSAADTLPACADAGGTCQPFVSGCGSMGAGPPDACAYSDETCCLQ